MSAHPPPQAEPPGARPASPPQDTSPQQRDERESNGTRGSLKLPKPLQLCAEIPLLQHICSQNPANNSWELPRLAGLPPARAAGPACWPRARRPRMLSDAKTRPDAAQPGQLHRGLLHPPQPSCRRAATIARSDAASKNSQFHKIIVNLTKNSKSHSGIHTGRCERIHCSLGTRVTQRRGWGEGDGAA